MAESSEQPSGPERVMVIDDDENYRTVVHRSLSRKGYEVFEAGSGAEGLELAVKCLPKVIVLDLRMPGMDGHTFLRRFQDLGLHAAVIVSSGAGDMNDVIEVMRQGAVDYLKKPWAPSELLAAVARAAERVDFLGNAAEDPGATAAVAKVGGSGSSAKDAFSAVLEAIQQGLHIPTVPIVVAELRQKLNDPSVQLPAIVELVSSDQWMAAEVLRLARSVLHGGHWKGLDLRAAVTRIGLKEVLTLAETAFASRCFALEDPELTPTLQEVWRFSVARAVFMRSLAPTVRVARVEADRAYVAGLFADLGASFLLKVVGEMKKARGTHFSPAEVLSFLRQNHAQAGAAVLKGWGLDAGVEHLARSHHAAWAGDPLRGLCRLASHLVVSESFGLDVTAAEALDDSELADLKTALKISEVAYDTAKSRGCLAVTELSSLVNV